MKVKINDKEYELQSCYGNSSMLSLSLINVDSLDELLKNAKAHKGSIIVTDGDKTVKEYVGYYVFSNMKIDNGIVILEYLQEYDDKQALTIMAGYRPSVEEAKTLRADIEVLANFADDDTASKNKWAYGQWEVGVVYKVGDKRVYQSTLYRCLQEHTSQETWNPQDATSLWAKVISEDPTGDIPVWEQPTSTNPYMRGDKVWYPAKDTTKYQSLIDNNVWSPMDYPQGWGVID